MRIHYHTPNDPCPIAVIMHQASWDQVEGLRQVFAKRTESGWVNPEWIDNMSNFVVDTYPGGEDQREMDEQEWEQE